MAETDGTCESFARYVLRVCKALKIKEMAVYREISGFERLRLDEGMSLIEYWLQRWQEDASSWARVS
jgi:hypothetical protein